MIHTHSQPVGDFNLIMAGEQRSVMAIWSHTQNHQVDGRLRAKLTDELGLVIACSGVKQRVVGSVSGGTNGVVIAFGIGHGVGNLVGGTHVGCHLMNIRLGQLAVGHQFVQ